MSHNMITGYGDSAQEYIKNQLKELNKITKKLRKDDNCINSRSFKSNRKYNIKYNVNMVYRKKHNIKQPKGSVRHGSSK